MAAPVIANVQTRGPENRDAGEGTPIPKPTGLAEGDMLVVICVGTRTSDTPNNWSSPSGTWNEIYNEGQTRRRIKAWWKIADSADVAASTFTVPGTGQSGGCTAHGVAYRITGHNSAVIGAAASNSSSSWACGITPSAADSLIIFAMVSANSAGGGSTASYAIATDNPGVWNEQYDSFGNNGTNDILTAGAAAERAATTLTGDASCTITTFGASSSSAGLIAIAPLPAGPTGLKTVNGLAVASVKTMNGLAIGSVKTAI